MPKRSREHRIAAYRAVFPGASEDHARAVLTDGPTSFRLYLTDLPEYVGPWWLAPLKPFSDAVTVEVTANPLLPRKGADLPALVQWSMSLTYAGPDAQSVADNLLRAFEADRLQWTPGTADGPPERGAVFTSGAEMLLMAASDHLDHATWQDAFAQSSLTVKHCGDA